MSDAVGEQPALDIETLRGAIREEYSEVASSPRKGFHFHTGRPMARRLRISVASGGSPAVFTSMSTTR